MDELVLVAGSRLGKEGNCCEALGIDGGEAEGRAPDMELQHHCGVWWVVYFDTVGSREPKVVSVGLWTRYRIQLGGLERIHRCEWQCLIQQQSATSFALKIYSPLTR